MSDHLTHSNHLEVIKLIHGIGRKKRLVIYIQATGYTEKPAAQKVGLLLKHIGDHGIDIYTNFDYDTIISKFDDYFTKRDLQLMLRERFWFHLKREPGQSFDSWVNAVKEKAAECKFPEMFREEATRDKLTFSCGEDSSKLKLYDKGARLNLQKAIHVLSLREATTRELHESKVATIDAVLYKKKHYPHTKARQKPPSTQSCCHKQ